MRGLLRRAALAVDRGAGHRLGQTGGERGVAGDVDALLADLHDATHDHVFDERGVDAVALDDRAHHVGREIDRVDVLESAVATSERRAYCVDDDGRRHGCLLETEQCAGWGAETRTRPGGQVWCRDRRPSNPPDPRLVPKWPGCAAFAWFTAAVHRVLVLRHGASTWNAEGRWQGWLDAPLTAEGEVQAAARARELAHNGVNPRVIYTSDLGRARRTAEIIGAHLERPVVPDDGLRERNGGEWQGTYRRRDRSGLAGDARRVAAG